MSPKQCWWFLLCGVCENTPREIHQGRKISGSHGWFSWCVSSSTPANTTPCTSLSARRSSSRRSVFARSASRGLLPRRARCAGAGVGVGARRRRPTSHETRDGRGGGRARGRVTGARGGGSQVRRLVRSQKTFRKHF